MTDHPDSYIWMRMEAHVSVRLMRYYDLEKDLKIALIREMNMDIWEWRLNDEKN